MKERREEIWAEERREEIWVVSSIEGSRGVEGGEVGRWR